MSIEKVPSPLKVSEWSALAYHKTIIVIIRRREKIVVIELTKREKKYRRNSAGVKSLLSCVEFCKIKSIKIVSWKKYNENFSIFFFSTTKLCISTAPRESREWKRNLWKRRKKQEAKKRGEKKRKNWFSWKSKKKYFNFVSFVVSV